MAQPRSRVRAYHLLGAEDGLDEEAQDAQQQLQQEQHADSLASDDLTVNTCDPSGFPEQVWVAAGQCSDRGRAVLSACQDLQTLRTAYHVHLARLAEPSGWEAAATQGFTPQQTLLQSGKQLFEPGSKRTLLPPLTQVAAPGQLLSDLRTGTRQGTSDAPGSGHTQGKLFNAQSTYSQAVFSTSERRKLALFEDQKGVWQHVEGLLAARTQRPPQDLAMSRGAEHRRKLETMDALERSMPLEDRCGGPEVWNMSLRNAWERVVPLGSLFSGLTVTIRTTPPYTNRRASKEDAAEKLQRKARERVLRIGHPLDHPELPKVQPPPHRSVFDKSALLGRSLTRRGRDWMNGELLRARLEQYAEAINRQFPYKPDMPSLVVTGRSLAEALAASLTHPVSLSDVLSHLNTTNPGAYEELKQICERLGYTLNTDEVARGEEAASDADATAAAATDTAAEPAVCQPGIHLSCSQQSIALNCPQGQVDRRDVTLTNSGSVALRYAWVKREPAFHPLTHALAAGSSKPAQAGAPFHMMQCEGVILPGETATTSVCFQPTEAGLFHASWRLETTPQWPEGIQPILLEGQGAATVPPARAPQRQHLDKQLYESEKTAKVRAAVERILVSAGPLPPRPHLESPEEEAACLAWDAANVSRWPPAYYPGPSGSQEAHDIYSAARAALVQALQPPVAPDPAAGKKVPAKTGKGAAAPAEEAAPIITWPETWSLSLTALEHILAELETAEAAAAATAVSPEAAATLTAPLPSQAAALRQRLASLLDSQPVCVPRDGRVLLRHAARAALLRIVDSVDDKLAALRSEFDQRVAEATASEGKSQPPTAQWLTDASKTGTKAQIKTLVPTCWEQIGKEKAAVADWVVLALSALSGAPIPPQGDAAAPPSDAAPAQQLHERQGEPAVQASGQAASAPAPGTAGVTPMGDEDLHWSRFALLREWVRLGLPARPPVVP